MKKKQSLTCAKCKEKETCKSLCKEMDKFLTKDFYNLSYQNVKEASIDENAIDTIAFISGLSKKEELKTRRIIIALLNPEDLKLLKLFASGLKQSEIATQLNMTQGAISVRLRRIKKDILKDSFSKIIDYIV